ncbi:zincin [Piromyces finnis]|uniref:Zincin n=1 Tax=Piromyces finnis TaxID=1754191 RepID=A0A1Y1UX37_9FUNG|nr:zincin [Piromyces finnis]|eukprot:ORX42211.1 zincin [Piromyces finnis]
MDEYLTDICYSLTRIVFTHALGRYFVLENSNNDTNAYAEKLLEYTKQSMYNRIPQMEWLDDETIEYAYKKIDTMTTTIGYTKEILDQEYIFKMYEGFDVSLDDFLTNQINYVIFMNNKILDFYEGGLESILVEALIPQNVNAYYTPLNNSIFIPIGILQTPFFSHGIPDYINYGGIGSIIGHELTHVFDSNGKNYDMNGYIMQWQTLAENLADNGGLTRAYESWKLSMKEDPEHVKKENQLLPGLSKYTMDQLFFISFGQIWCNNEYFYPKNDPHASGSARVRGTIANSKEFAAAFNCPLKSKMNPDKKCQLW